MTQYSMTLPNWSRYSAYVYYSETRLGQQRVTDLNTLLAVELHKFGRLDMHYQSQAGSNRRYGANWYFKFGSKEDGYLRLGMDSVHLANGSSGLLPVAGLRIPLPKHQVLEVSYLRDVSTQMLQVQLGGKIVRPREISRDSHGVPRVAAHANITGLVYIDVNYNGEFDSGDRALPDVRVWRDGEVMALTDARGYYRFDNVDAGAHTIRAELAGVPAGFVFAGSSEHTLAVMPNHENRRDFRVIKTGQIEGKVTYMDYSADSERPVESGFPDAHLLATGDRDTYSEGNGSFLLGDLPPGQYEIHLDPATVPKGYVSQPPSYVVRVTPGTTSREPRFRLAIPPKPVIQIRVPDQMIQTPESPATDKQRQPRGAGL
jgi:SdrD B-like domain